MRQDINLKEADYDFKGSKFRVRELAWYDRDLAIPAAAAFYCGGNFKGATPVVQVRALLLAEANVRIVKSPDWFQDVTYHFEDTDELEAFVEGARALLGQTPDGDAVESGEANKP